MLLKIGSSGDDVKELQEKLGLTPDGKFGPGTEEAVKKWQKENDLSADGIVGRDTWNVLFSLKLGSSGDDVKELQEKLGLPPDGKFGPGTEEAVKKLQKENGLNVDGIVGYNTWNELFSLRLGSSGDEVSELQKKLGLTPDGKFGKATEEAVKKWQTTNGLTADGIVRPCTWRLFPLDVDEDDDDTKLTKSDSVTVAVPATPATIPATPAASTVPATPVASTVPAAPAPAEISGLKLNKLKGHVPDAVLAEIPDCAVKFKINTPLRLAHFLAQCAHESAGFKVTQENLKYSVDGLRKVFKKYFSEDIVKSYARQPEKIASRVYANRMGNGDEASKEGYKYCGRGYIQLTGKNNYAEFRKVVDEDILSTPELVSKKYSLLSAGWFWNSRSLNSLADKGATDAVVTAITKKVNGGTIGLADRIKHFKEYYALLGS